MNEGTCIAEADLLASPALVVRIAREECWQPWPNGVWEVTSERLRERGVTALTVDWDDEGRRPTAITAYRGNGVIGTMAVRQGLAAPVLHTIAAIASTIGA
jgi:hypothetical protein